MALKIIAWIIALAAIAGGVYYMMTREAELEVTAIKVERGPVESTVAAISSGMVMPARKSMVAAGMIGTIDKVLIQEGSRVKEGDVLVEMAHAELDAQVALAKANLEAGQAKLSQARIGAGIAGDVAGTRVGQAKAQLDAAQADYERIKALMDKKAVSQSDFDKVALAERVAREMYTAALAGQGEDKVHNEEIKSAESIIEQLGAAVQAAEAMRDKAFVRAPFDGVVAKKLLDVGEAVAIGLPVLNLVQDTDLYVQAPFDEANAAQIKLGQNARIELDAYPNTTFPGEVTYISPTVSFNMDLSRTLDVKVRITEGVDKFISGMSADVTIIIEKKEGVLFVPSETLVRDEFAYKIVNGRAVHTAIEPGIGNWEYREILDGLNEGDPIVSSISLKALTDGVRVNVVDELPGM